MDVNVFSKESLGSISLPGSSISCERELNPAIRSTKSGAGRVILVIDKIGILGDLLGVLPFLNFHSTNTLHFLILHVIRISLSSPVKNGKPPCSIINGPRSLQASLHLILIHTNLSLWFFWCETLGYGGQPASLDPGNVET